MEFLNETEAKAGLRAVWWASRKYAYDCRTKELSYHFETYLQSIFHDIFCEKCRPHARKRLQEVPYRNFRDIYINGWGYIGPLLYVIDFKNAVNRRVGTPEMTLDQVMAEIADEKVICNSCKLNVQEEEKQNKLLDNFSILNLPPTLDLNIRPDGSNSQGRFVIHQNGKLIFSKNHN